MVLDSLPVVESRLLRIYHHAVVVLRFLSYAEIPLGRDVSPLGLQKGIPDKVDVVRKEVAVEFERVDECLCIWSFVIEYDVQAMCRRSVYERL